MTTPTAHRTVLVARRHVDLMRQATAVCQL